MGKYSDCWTYPMEVIDEKFRQVVPKTLKINGKALDHDITLTPGDVGALDHTVLNDPDVIQLKDGETSVYPQAAIPIGSAGSSGATLDVPACDMLIATMHNSESGLLGLWLVAFNGFVVKVFGGTKVTLTSNVSADDIVESLTITTTAGNVRVSCIPLSHV